ncbi:MAG: EamA family transporter [Actinomycetota bacterium]
MLPLLLALGSGMGWGTADFLAGLAVRRQALFVVMAISQAAGLVFVAAVVLLRGEAPQQAIAVWYGVAAGVLGAIGLAALYRALAIGRMSVVAPTAALSGVVPLAWGLGRGDHPSAVQVAGIALAVLGVILASRSLDEGSGRRTAVGVGLALIAAVTLGVLVVLLDEIGRTDPLWGVLMVRVSALTLLSIALLVRRPSLRMSFRDLRWLVAVGVLDNGSNLLFALAADAGGLLALTSVLGSLYPVATVVLARLVLHERLERHQAAGVAAALVGVALIAGG